MLHDIISSTVLFSGSSKMEETNLVHLIFLFKRSLGTNVEVPALLAC